MDKNEIDKLFMVLEQTSSELIGAIGIPYDFSPKSLDIMEEVIINMFPEGRPRHPTTFLPFGYYLGEVIIHNIPGATWDFNAKTDHLFDLPIKVDNVVLFPFKRISNFWEDRTDGLSVYYRTVSKMISGEIELDDEGNGEWNELPGGDKFRFRRATEEETKNYKENK